MKKNLRIASVVMASLLVTVSVSGCSLFPKKEVQTAPKVITIWGFESEDLWQPLIKDTSFLQELGGFELRYIKKSLNDSYENDTINSILSGQGPDVWAIPNDWVPRHKDKLFPATADLIKKFSLADNLVPAASESNIIGNQLYGYAPGVDTLVMYYNPKILEQAATEYEKQRPARKESEDDESYRERPDVVSFEEQKRNILEVPSTWAKFIEAERLITIRSGNNIIRSGFAAGTTTNTSYSQDIIYSLMLQNKIKMVSDDMTMSNFNLPTGIASGGQEVSGKYVLDFYTQFSNPASSYYSWNSSLENNLDAFAAGKVAYIMAPGSTTNYFSQKYPNFSYKIATIPQITENQDEDTAYARFYTYVVPKLSNYPSQAWTVISRAPINGAFHASSKKDENFKGVKIDNPKMYQANIAHIWNKGRYPKEVDAIFRSAVDDILNGKQNSENAINTAATKVTELLRKSEW